MPRLTQERAWARISALGTVDAGRLTGHCLRHDLYIEIPPGTLSPEAASTLRASLSRPAGAPVTGDAIFYVVSSDRTPVAWLTYDATVVTPDAQLTAYQRAHQQRAVNALSHLNRHAVFELAKLRDNRELRTTAEPTPFDTGTWLLVAAAADPTVTWWTEITGDLTASLRHLLTVTHAHDAHHTDPDTTRTGEILIVAASGYGDYGQRAPVLDLATLCAIEQLTSTTQLPASVIGNWLHQEDTIRGGLATAQIADAFSECYAGWYDTRDGFAIAERDRRGWTAALTEAGIPLYLFNLEAFRWELFSTHVHDVRSPDGRIAVFRWRQQATS